MSRYRDMTEEQRAKRRERVRDRARKRYADDPEFREKRKERARKRYAEHTDSRKNSVRKYQAKHPNKLREFMAKDLNSQGVTKNHIRTKSRICLFSKHSKLSGYEIHHAFGYDDCTKFIYIPKTLHLQIHKLLRDNNISSDTDHWMAIRDLVNSCEQYTYISV